MAKPRRSEAEIKKTTVGRPGGNLNVGRGAMKVKAAGKKNSVAKPVPVVMAPKSHKKMSEIEKAAKAAASPFKTGVALARASAAAKKPKG